MHFTGLPLTLVSLLLSLQHTTALPLDRQERALSDSALDRTAKGVAWDDQGFAPPVELIAYYPVVTMPNASSVYQQGGMMTVSCERARASRTRVRDANRRARTGIARRTHSIELRLLSCICLASMSLRAAIADILARSGLGVRVSKARVADSRAMLRERHSTTV